MVLMSINHATSAQQVAYVRSDWTLGKSQAWEVGVLAVPLAKWKYRRSGRDDVTGTRRVISNRTPEMEGSRIALYPLSAAFYFLRQRDSSQIAVSFIAAATT